MSIEDFNKMTKNEVKNENEIEGIEEESFEDTSFSEESEQDVNESLREANIAEIKSKEKEEIGKLSAEIVNLKSPEEIQSQIEVLEKECQMKKEAYQEFTHMTSTDTGLGNLGSFSSGEKNIESLEKKFPGISNSLELMKVAKKKNSVGYKFWKEPELDDFSARAIKNYLTSGNLGKFTNAKAEEVAKTAVKKFISENNNSEADVVSVRKAIWGDKNINYYDEAIAGLKEDLAKASESK